MSCRHGSRETWTRLTSRQGAGDCVKTVFADDGSDRFAPALLQTIAKCLSLAKCLCNYATPVLMKEPKFLTDQLGASFDVVLDSFVEHYVTVFLERQMIELGPENCSVVKID
jgi:hypothetical protein